MMPEMASWPAGRQKPPPVSLSSPYTTDPPLTGRPVSAGGVDCDPALPPPSSPPPHAARRSEATSAEAMIRRATRDVRSMARLPPAQPQRLQHDPLIVPACPAHR